MDGYRDEHHRLLPGVVPGRGMSWWWHEQGITREQNKALTSEEHLALLCRYFREVAEGRRPSVPRAEWVGPHDPFRG